MPLHAAPTLRCGQLKDKARLITMPLPGYETGRG